MSEVRMDDVQAIVSGDHRDPFGFLGPHAVGGNLQVRSFQPGARAVRVVDAANDAVVAELPRVHEAGLFAGAVSRPAPFDYRLAVDWAEGSALLDDPYRLPPILDGAELWQFAHGELDGAYRFMGAHLRNVAGRDGVLFAVWAPNARRVSVIGDFNYWDGRRHPMRLRHDGGVWELFIPGLGDGARYKYEIKTAAGVVLPPKADPFAFQAEMRPQSASLVCALPAPAAARQHIASDRARPMTIYEVHLGSWRRADDGGFLSYDQFAEQLVPYVAELGFTHVEFLPVTEHPFDGSWGYQPTGLFAPSSRFGAPAGFRRLIDAFHAAGIGVILDWVPGHFPNDPHGLAEFDGTHLFDHADPRLGLHKDWDTLIYNYGRREVANFLISSALFWLDHYGIDALRVDAVASMLYLDYSREPGEWLPNRFGGRENIEAIEFLRRLNTRVYDLHPQATTIAEESTAWPMVSRPVYAGGLGFGYKWNMGWMHDTLSYMALDPIHRTHHHDTLTFSLIYAFDENFVLPLSHDEVVYGKRSLLDKMPGDDWQQRANLRAYFGFMYGHPGKKLLFMGDEFAQRREWHHDRGLDWHLLGDAGHRGIRQLVGDLNRLHRQRSALHARDCEPAGFEWIDSNDRQNSVVSFLRRGPDGDWLIVVCNFTPVVRHGYRIGVPEAGRYREILNTDAAQYGGSGVGSFGATDSAAASPAPLHGRPCTLELTLPPLAAVYLERVPER